MRSLLALGLIAYYATSFNGAVAEGEPNFASKFFKTVSEDVPGNLICSSISADMLLSMVAFGAGGNTEKQLVSVLTNDGSLNKQNIQFLLQSLQGLKDVDLHIANRVFIQEGSTTKTSYKELVEEYLFSGAETVNFGDSVKASQTINNWCANQTNNRITELFEPDALSKDSALVLVNAVYFKGTWANEFEPAITGPRPFRLNGKTVKDIPTMHDLNEYRYGQLPELKASVVELPYISSDSFSAISMFIILPDEVDGFKQLKNNLDQITLGKLRKVSTRRTVNIFLPKFKIESSLDLEVPLVKLGLTDMFTDAANFTGIVEAGGMKVSKIVQKAFLEVNEKGSEAAGATGAGLDFKFGREEDSSEPIVEFIVDRPFVSIIGTGFGVPLFSALIVEPSV